MSASIRTCSMPACASTSRSTTPAPIRRSSREALKAAAAEDILAGLPRGVETRLGENGAGVSGGEARRLTIARAIYAGAAVILADEPTADLDHATADKVTDALIAAAENGASLIVATHDPRLAARMDREIKLADAP